MTLSLLQTFRGAGLHCRWLIGLGTRFKGTICVCLRGETICQPELYCLLCWFSCLIGAVPSWPYSRSWGYYPSGLLGIILLIVLIMLVTGRL